MDKQDFNRGLREFLPWVKDSSCSLYSVLVSSKIEMVDEETLFIYVKFSFHSSRLLENMELLNRAAARSWDRKLAIVPITRKSKFKDSFGWPK